MRYLLLELANGEVNGTVDSGGSESGGHGGGSNSSTLDLLILLGLCTLIMIVLIYVLFRVAWGQARDFIHIHHEEEEARKARIARRCKSYMIPEGMKIVLLPDNQMGYALMSTSPDRSIGHQMSIARSTASEYPPPLYHVDLQSNYSTDMGTQNLENSGQLVRLDLNGNERQFVRFDSPSYVRFDSSNGRSNTPNQSSNQNPQTEPLLDAYRTQQQQQQQQQQQIQQQQQQQVQQQQQQQQQQQVQQQQSQQQQQIQIYNPQFQNPQAYFTP